MGYNDKYDDLGSRMARFKKENYLVTLKKSNSRDYYNQTCRLVGLPYIEEKTGDKQHKELLLSNLNYVNLYFLRAKQRGLLDQAYLRAEYAITSFLHDSEYTKFEENAPERGVYIDLLKRWRSDVKCAYGDVKNLSVEDSIKIFNSTRDRIAQFAEDHYAGSLDLKKFSVGAEIRKTVNESKKKETQGQNE